ncbi:MAG: c-type cytochrome [Gammaproteobacteria bacterium]
MLGLLTLYFSTASSQESPYGDIGYTPTQAEVETLDISIMPDGEGLPPGQGTARQGEPLYQTKCVMCHGPNLEGRRDYRVGRLAGGVGTMRTDKPVKSFGSYNPVVTTLWDYTRRAMPKFEEGSLSNEEVYALSAYILYKNGIIGQDEVMNAQSLPKVEMPNRNGFIPPALEDILDIEARGCRSGRCR